MSYKLRNLELLFLSMNEFDVASDNSYLCIADYNNDIFVIDENFLSKSWDSSCVQSEFRKYLTYKSSKTKKMNHNDIHCVKFSPIRFRNNIPISKIFDIPDTKKTKDYLSKYLNNKKVN